MSHTTIKAIYPGEKTCTYGELRNSWGSAPPVWDAMAKRYLGEHWFGYIRYGELGDEFWALWKRTDIPEEHRLVFMFTFDRAYVARENYPRMAAAIRRFLRDFPPIPDNVNHWPVIAHMLEQNPDVPGIGLHCTSVSEDPFIGPWNEEKGEHDPPDWSQIWEVCAGLDALQKDSSATA